MRLYLQLSIRDWWEGLLEEVRGWKWIWRYKEKRETKKSSSSSSSSPVWCQSILHLRVKKFALVVFVFVVVFGIASDVCLFFQKYEHHSDKIVSRRKHFEGCILYIRAVLSNPKFLVATFATFVATKTLLSPRYKELSYKTTI